MDDLNRLYQLVAARDEGDLSAHGLEVLAALALKMPEHMEAIAHAKAERAAGRGLPQ